jgi:hypothetical protein
MGTGFAQTATSFALPPGYTGVAGGRIPFDWIGNTGYCVSGANIPSYTLADLTGDGRLDVVVTIDCTDTSVGTSHWRVYPHSGSGFAQTATSFALPPGYTGVAGGRRPFDLSSSSAYCFDGATIPSFGIGDYTGDGKPDMIVTTVCADATVGTSHWRIYANTGSGFAQTAASFALPPGYTGVVGGRTPFDRAGVTAYCFDGATIPTSVVTDLTGDGRPDMIVTVDCTDTTVGASHWRVYAHTGSGFAQTATVFALPPGYTGGAGGRIPFAQFADTAYCADGATIPAHMPVDLTSDGKPDMVVTDDCTDTSVGVSQWRIYANTGAAFAQTATSFALPPGYTGVAGGRGPFDWFGTSAYCTGGATIPASTFVDLTGDAKPDMVVTNDCTDTAVGASEWRVYAHTGSGFAQTPSSFALPPGYTGVAGGRSPFDWFATTPYCTGGATIPASTVTDLTADGKPDMIIHDECTDTSVGTSSWLVFPNVCAP